MEFWIFRILSCISFEKNMLIGYTFDTMKLTIHLLPALRSIVLHVFRWFLSQFTTNFHEILQGAFSSGYYREYFIGKYCIAKKLDHLACNAIRGLI